MAAFGTLTVVGDSIFAQPSDFFAQATDGGIDSFAALGTVTVVAKAGYEFDLVQVAQQGDYTLSGAGATVSVSAILDVSDSSNAATTVSTPLSSSSDFTVQDALTGWSSLASVDLSTAFWNGVTSIDLDLDTLLSATTAANGEFARIDNKFTGGGLVTVMTTPVPLPPSLWLFGAGLLALLRKARTASA